MSALLETYRNRGHPPKKVIWVSQGNNRESLDQFFRVLGSDRCQKIETVAKDLHHSYAVSCREYIPQATEVADPFHVVQRLNQAIDESRKELSVGSVLKVSKRRMISNLQWILRYKQENMRPHQLQSLDKLEQINKPLYQAYLHKEAFYEFFAHKPSEMRQAESFLVHWIVDAYKIGLKGLTEFAQYIQRNTQILLNAVKTQRSSAISEGINRKISVIKSMAYGYRNIQYFMLKILQRCGVLGWHWIPSETG
jgi:transposase